MGRWIVDSQGRVLLFHGLNEVAKRPPAEPAAFGFRAADASWMASNGFRLVRLGVLFSGLMPTPGKVSRRYLAAITSSVDLLARFHIFTLIDFHQDGYGPAVGSDGFPAWMTLTRGAASVNAHFPQYYVMDPAVQQAFQSFWDNARRPGGVGLQTYALMGYAAVARQFARDPWVIGYDVLNEPWPGTTWAPCLAPAGCPSLVRSELTPFYDKVAAVIRRQGSRQIVFEEPFATFNLGGSAPDLSLPAGQAGMSFHMYTSTPAAEPGLISKSLAWSRSTGGALLDSEWSSATGASGIVRQAGELDAALVPWAYWSFAGCSTGCRRGESTSAVIPDLAKAPSGTNLNQTIASSLTQPYPLATAGVPTADSYDTTTRTLRFAYSTSEVTGGSFAKGTVTVIEAPTSVYPSGYTVSVSGARVVSKPCSSLLEIEAAAGARVVRVTVDPASNCPQ